MNVLPGYYEYIVPYTDQPGHNIVYLTPYYTMGWFSAQGFFKRNAGMFWEPGAHAVYLNIAILFIFSGALNGMKSKSRNILLGILLSGSLSTMSTTGYLTLAVSFGFLIFRDPKRWNIRKNMIIIIVVAAAVLGIALFGSVFDKLIYRNGSYGTRLNDTVSGLSAAFQDWFLGKGMFVDISGTLKIFGIRNMFGRDDYTCWNTHDVCIFVFITQRFKKIVSCFGNCHMLRGFVFLFVYVF